MNLSDDLIDEVEGRWRMTSCLMSLLGSHHGLTDTRTCRTEQASSRAPNVDILSAESISRLIISIAKGVNSALASLWLQRYGELVSASFPEDTVTQTGSDNVSQLVSRLRIRCPLMLRGDVVGCIDLQSPKSEEGFRTEHREFVFAVVKVIEHLLADERFRISEDGFFQSIYQHRKLDSVLLQVWKITEDLHLDLSEKVDLVTQAVARGLPHSAIVTAIWNEGGKALSHYSASAPEPHALSELLKLIEERQILQSDSAFCNLEHINALWPSPVGDPTEGVPPVAAEVVLTQLTRLGKCRGVLGIVRCNSTKSFSTSEKHLLCLATALFSEKSAAKGWYQLHGSDASAANT
jgi:hypothetical protein